MQIDQFKINIEYLGIKYTYNGDFTEDAINSLNGILYVFANYTNKSIKN